MTFILSDRLCFIDSGRRRYRRVFWKFNGTYLTFSFCWIPAYCPDCTWYFIYAECQMSTTRTLPTYPPAYVTYIIVHPTDCDPYWTCFIRYIVITFIARKDYYNILLLLLLFLWSLVFIQKPWICKSSARCWVTSTFLRDWILHIVVIFCIIIYF